MCYILLKLFGIQQALLLFILNIWHFNINLCFFFLQSVNPYIVKLSIVDDEPTLEVRLFSSFHLKWAQDHKDIFSMILSPSNIKLIF